MSYTPNLHLEKPAQEDFYDVDHFNANMDIIDAAVNEKHVKNTQGLKRVIESTQNGLVETDTPQASVSLKSQIDDNGAFASQIFTNLYSVIRTKADDSITGVVIQYNSGTAKVNISQVPNKTVAQQILYIANALGNAINDHADVLASKAANKTYQHEYRYDSSTHKVVEEMNANISLATIIAELSNVLYTGVNDHADLIAAKAADKMSGYTLSIVNHEVVAASESNVSLATQIERLKTALVSLSTDHKSYIASKNDDVGLSVSNGKLCVTYTV